MELIKIDIGSRMNLTLLAKAYFDGLFPLSTYGELYYEENLYNVNFPVRYLFFKEDYYKQLISFISNEQTVHKMQISNSPNDWSNLVNALKNNKTEVSADIGMLNLYTFPAKPNYAKVVLDEEKTNAILSSEKALTNDGEKIRKEIKQDLKRIYEYIPIEIFGKKWINISVPTTEENALEFPLTPVIRLLEKYEQEVEGIKLLKRDDEKKNINISIAVKNWGW